MAEASLEGWIEKSPDTTPGFFNNTVLSVGSLPQRH